MDSGRSEGTVAQSRLCGTTETENKLKYLDAALMCVIYEKNCVNKHHFTFHKFITYVIHDTVYKLSHRR